MRYEDTYATQKSYRTAARLVQHAARASQLYGGNDRSCKSRAACGLPLLGVYWKGGSIGVADVMGSNDRISMPRVGS